MQVTTLSFFRFEGAWNKFWGFMYMGLAKDHLRRMPGIGFFKMMGIGRGDGFNPAPDFSVYCILATWDSHAKARDAVLGHGIYADYRAHSSESWSVFLSATRSHGSWDQAAPFDPVKSADNGGPIGVLTRASINRSRLVEFWKSVPDVSDLTEGHAPLRFRIGMGERPIMQLMTFSIWDDLSAIQQFAYHPGKHRDTMRMARDKAWFTEELFVRFRVLEATGTWAGVDPLNGAP